MRVKHAPMRMCIGTQTQHPKRDMVRLVRTSDGHIVIDPTGKMSGSRGVYLCKSAQAAEAAIKHKRFEAEFEQPISKEDTEAIRAFFSKYQEQ
ncbi:MAG: YlxR family protein [Chloroflexi bacterium]|nr:YlxR family protein [Chloroflexota bacterium]